MARTTNKLRLKDIDHEQVGAECVDALAEEASRIVRALRPRYQLAESKNKAEPEIAKYVAQLGAYAVHGTALRVDVEAAIERLSPLRACAEAVGSLDPAEPQTPLEFVIAGARARAALDDGKPLTSVQLAVLVGLDRDHVNGLALREEIPSSSRSTETRHRPWVFKPTSALRGWIAQYTG